VNLSSEALSAILAGPLSKSLVHSLLDLFVFNLSGLIAEAPYQLNRELFLCSLLVLLGPSIRALLVLPLE
jgi:hypothetical protein